MSRQVVKTYSIFLINIYINFSPQVQLVHQFFRKGNFRDQVLYR